VKLSRTKLPKAARDCISREISKHCRKKRGKCEKLAGRAQATAIGYSVCRRKGFRIAPRR
jgi:hypothetical protein